MSERDELEQDLRIDQMTINIEKMRAEMHWEFRRFVVQAILATAAAVGAGVALGRVLFGS